MTGLSTGSKIVAIGVVVDGRERVRFGTISSLPCEIMQAGIGFN